MFGGEWADRLVASIAHEHALTDRVWTEVVYRWGAMNDMLPKEDYCALVASLVRLGYHHTKLFPEAAIKIAMDADWDFRKESFVAAIEWLANPGVNSDGKCRLAEALLPKVYNTKNEVLASATVQNILYKIGSRRDGELVVRELRRRVSIYCGLDFTVEKRLSDDFDIWLQHK